MSDNPNGYPTGDSLNDPAAPAYPPGGPVGYPPSVGYPSSSAGYPASSPVPPSAGYPAQGSTGYSPPSGETVAPHSFAPHSFTPPNMSPPNMSPPNMSRPSMSPQGEWPRTPTQPLPPTRPLAVSASPVTIQRLRHRREIPMLVLAVIVNIGAIAYWWLLKASGKEIKGFAAFVPIVFVLPIIIPIIVRLQYWSVIGDAVEVTPTQLPDLFAQYIDVAQEMGMPEQGKTLPRLYLTNGMGSTNAFASKCAITKSFVVITSDMLDVMYEHNDVNAVRFVLAHELGHIKMRHVSFWRFVINAIPNYLWIGRSVTRAQEYTADRVAMHYAPEGAASLLLLYAGKRMYRRVDVGEYFRSFDNHKIGFWARVANLLSTHPQGHRRMRALWEMSSKGLDHHGKML